MDIIDCFYFPDDSQEKAMYGRGFCLCPEHNTPENRKAIRVLAKGRKEHK